MQSIFGSQSVMDFITAWPILAIPEFLFLILLSKFFKNLPSSSTRLLYSSMPGILILLAWNSSEGFSLNLGYWAGTLFIAPTNIISPPVFVYSIIQNFLCRKLTSKVSKKIELSLMALLMFLYIWEQLVIMVALQLTD